MNPLTLSPGRFPGAKGPVLTVVLDGVGIGPKDEGNAVHLAQTPVLDALAGRDGSLSLAAHGPAVGLPTPKDMGNSEVGHNALGAGRVFEQGASLVEDAIESGALFDGETWRWLLDGVRASGAALHFIGLLSDGNVHSHERHLHALLRAAARADVNRVRVHILLDGRDVDARSALAYVDRLEGVLRELNAAGRDFHIASGGGRMIITMDRYEAEWEMVAKGWAHHVHGDGRRFPSALAAINTLREETGATDQFLPPFVIADDKGPVGPIRDGASVVFFNFRGDRAIEISRAFEDDIFEAFDRGLRPKVRYAGMMQYDGDLALPARFLVAPPSIEGTLGEHLAYNGVTQFACSETQKFGHVTYFWNGNRSDFFDSSLEHYVEVGSDVIPFEQRPWMKAAEIVDATLSALRTGTYRAGRINLANGDMVGHTGDRDAAVLAVQCVDWTLGRLLAGIEALGGIVLVTADHGNCEEMYGRDKRGGFTLGADGRPSPKTSHTTNPVPLYLFDPTGSSVATLGDQVADPGLGNVAATVCELLGYAPPEGYLPSLLTAKGQE